tara:strand:+ start:265 stop:444 length:180 start_codon:yes stop_codon:yes gene_type:complete
VLVVLVNLHRLQDQELKEQTLLLLVYQQQGEEQEDQMPLVPQLQVEDQVQEEHLTKLED